MISLLEMPFRLKQASLVFARVSAINVIGQSEPSLYNSVSVLVETVPLQPSNPPSRNPSTTQTTLVTDY
jgi:hypothetical protein